jgi:hypothetical protein
VFADPEEVHADPVGKNALFDDVADRLGMRRQATIVIAGAVPECVEAEFKRELRRFSTSRPY